MKLRRYRVSDCSELTRLFYDTVHSVCARDYTPEQLDAWADGHPDLETWDRSLRAHDTLVVEEGGRILGFGDMTADRLRPVRRAGAPLLRFRVYGPRVTDRTALLPGPGVSGGAGAAGGAQRGPADQLFDGSAGGWCGRKEKIIK